MSTPKKKLSSELVKQFQAIQDLLIKIKHTLNDTKRGTSPPSIRSDLLQVTSLAESFSKKRPRSNKDWLDVADVLDREGVDLWNASVLITEKDDQDSRISAAMLRLAGFRLIEAGLESKPPIETLMYVLQLASKAGASLSAVGNHDLAASMLTSAAKYEEALRKADDQEHSHAQARGRAIVMYYSSRMEAAWKEGNDGIAEFSLQKVTDDLLALLPPRDREMLASKILEIGKSILRTGSQDINNLHRGPRAREALKWLQKGFAIIEPCEDAGNTDGKILKRSILRSLARAYFLSSSEDPEHLARAEAALNELLDSSQHSSGDASSEYQQLRWMRIAVLRKQKAAPPVFLEAFRTIIENMTPSESNITDILQEMRTFTQEHPLVTAVHLHCLRRILEVGDGSSYEQLDRLLLSLLFHCSRDVDHSRAMQDIATAYDCLIDAHFELSKVSAMACLTLLWQFGDRLYQAKRWPEAADWFVSGTHRVFGSIVNISNSKCLRKAALCYIENREYAKAAAMVRRCSDNEAATHYVRLLAAVQQGLEDEAISAANAMIHAPDFDRKMLMLAIRLANDTDMKGLLLCTLEALLDTLKARDGPDAALEAMTLIRCIVRLVTKILAEPGSNRTLLTPILVRHFRTATILTTNVTSQLDAAVISKDISWLWRTAYNYAIQTCSEWEDAEESASDLFDISRQLLEAYRGTTVGEVDSEVQLCVIDASFAAVAGRVFATRQQTTGQEHEANRLQALAEEIISCKERIQSEITNAKSLDRSGVSRAKSYLHVLRVFEVETLCRLQDWEHVLKTIEDAIQADTLAVRTFEAIADILWVEKNCPSGVLFTALEALLHASLDRSSLSIDKFSRWLRAVCTMLLARNTAADRTKAVQYVEQAAQVLGTHLAEAEPGTYPLDERYWLLGTSYNTGIECLHASSLVEAKRWFEASISICRFVPDGVNRAGKISETYTQLLERYTAHSAAMST